MRGAATSRLTRRAPVGVDLPTVVSAIVPALWKLQTNRFWPALTNNAAGTFFSAPAGMLTEPIWWLTPSRLRISRLDPTDNLRFCWQRRWLRARGDLVRRPCWDVDLERGRRRIPAIEDVPPGKAGNGSKAERRDGAEKQPLEDSTVHPTR